MMVWNTALDELERALAQRYATREAINRILDMAQLDRLRFSFEGKPVEIWHEILYQNQETDKLQKIIEVARKDYHDDNDLMQAIQVYTTYAGSRLQESDITSNFLGPSSQSPMHDVIPNNLPSPLTTFIGRTNEIAELKHLLLELEVKPRLLTLTGPGGVGKTRLALEVAEQVLHEFRDGVWLVKLEGLDHLISDHQTILTSVVQTILMTLDVAESKRSLIDTLVLYLRPKYLLLILDNCEHIVSAIAECSKTLLTTCRNLRIIVTSRSVLGVQGEVLYQIPALEVPDPQYLSPLEILEEKDAFRLFSDRARLAEHNFTIKPENVQALAKVCRLLDGIPLAIELAAARLKHFGSVEQLAAELDTRRELLLPQLVNGDPSVPRQMTMQATIDWSYQLLSVTEQQFLNRLAVFAGGWTRNAAEEVCVGAGILPEDVFNLLSELVDKSLVQREPLHKEWRYRLLSTIREYGAKQLKASGEALFIKERHTDYYTALAVEAESKLVGPEQVEWLSRLEVEHDNLRVVLSWSLTEPIKTNIGLRLVGALATFWLKRGYLTEGRERLKAVIAAADGAPVSLRAKAYYGAGRLAVWQDDLTEAETLFAHSLALYMEGDDTGMVAWAQHGLSTVAREQGDYSRATALIAQSLVTFRSLNDQPGVAAALHMLGTVVQAHGDYEQAGALFEESLRLSTHLGDIHNIARTQHRLGGVAQYRGDYGLAQQLHAESLSLFQRLGDKWGIATTLRNLGQVAHYEGNAEQATLYFEKSLALCRELDSKSGIAWGLHHLGEVAQNQGNYDRAQPLHEESLTLFRELHYRLGIAWGLHHLGEVAQNQGNYDRAYQLHTESLSLFRELGDKRGIAWSLHALGNVMRHEGQVVQAESLYEESLTLFSELGEEGSIAWTSRNLGSVELAQGKYEEAKEHYKTSLKAFRTLDDKGGVAATLHSLGRLAYEQGNYSQAEAYLKASLSRYEMLEYKQRIASTLRHLGRAIAARSNDEDERERALLLLVAAMTLRESLGAPLTPSDKVAYDKEIDQLRSQLGEDKFSAASSLGRTMSLNQVMTIALK